jgi:sporulation protein YlmC with PRC-barrel domain
MPLDEEVEDTEAGWLGYTPSDVTGKAVYDLNGHKLGRVAECETDHGRVQRIAVELDPKARRALDAPAVATLPADAVLTADWDVQLNEAAEYLLHPERAPPAVLDPELAR